MIELANTKEDLINFITEHKVINIRKLHLNDLKNGFNCFKLIDVCVFIINLIILIYLSIFIINHFLYLDC